MNNLWFVSFGNLILPITLLLTILLLVHSLVFKFLGAKISYLLWALIPLGLFAYLLPMPWLNFITEQSGEIQRYVVSPSAQFQQQLQLQLEKFQALNGDYLVWLWFVGALSIFAVWFVSHINFARKLKLTFVNDSRYKFVLPKNLTLYQSEQAFSPMLVGLFKQKLIIPENFNDIYSSTQQTLIIEHEICHFDRNDIYWNLIALICVALFWFHPLVWLAYFSFRRDQELSCDQTVLARKQIQSRINYSKALLVAAQNAPPLAFAQLSFKKYGDKHLMFERIKNIKTNKQATKLGLVMVVATSVTLLSGLSFAGNSVGKTDNEKQVFRTPPKEKASLMPIIRVEPKYPIKAAMEKIEGSVVLKFDIDTDGSVKNVEVVVGKPANIFDKVAITALKQWQYEVSNELSQNNLVQLDFRMDENSDLKNVNLIEKIRVTH
jgi:TonB family protein